MISIIVPTANRPQLVTRAVKSALAQSLTNIEVVIVIDGPDPETTQALNAIADSRLRLIQNARPGGSAEARNVGVTAAQGEWVAFLDDDDEWLKDKLELQLAVTSPNKFVIVSCLNYVVTSLQRYIWPRRVYDNACPLDEYLFDRRSWFRGGVMLQCSSLLMPRQLCLELMFRPIHDDWDMLLRAAKGRGVEIVTVRQPLVIHHTEDGRESLGASFDWRKSLDWADTHRFLFSRRAYAGFCLTVISPQAAKAGDHLAFFVLLYCALRHGSPRPIQLALYLAIWLIPMHQRQKLRSLWYRRTPSRVVSSASGCGQLPPV
ncbi:MAG: glycosyltransferase family 2 protein [Xanthobacteraceae bacterium]